MNWGIGGIRVRVPERTQIGNRKSKLTTNLVQIKTNRMITKIEELKSNRVLGIGNMKLEELRRKHKTTVEANRNEIDVCYSQYFLECFFATCPAFMQPK